MIVRFFKTGQSAGDSAVNYLLHPRDHKGELRAEQPEVLEGSPKLTIDLINSITRQYKYASGCLAFRASEQPDKVELRRILDRFKAVVAPGLSQDQFNCLFVLHREAPDLKTGQVGFHVHFVLPMTLLSGKAFNGKDLTGKRWNPHPPGQQTIETFSLFTDILNHEQGWARVTEKPLRVGIDSFWRKANQANFSQKAELLRREVSKAINSGVVNNRDELCQFLDQTLGLTITRQTDESVSVKFPGSAKAMRLKGAMFETHSDYATLRNAASQKTGTEMLSVPQYEQALQRLSQLLTERALYMQGARTRRQPHNTTTKKEPVYGRFTKRPQRGHSSGEAYERVSRLPNPKSGLERDMFSSSAGQRRYGDGGYNQANHAGPQEIAKPVQHVEHAYSSVAQRGRQRFQGGATSAVGSNIDQQIWALAVQLNECETGSSEAMSIVSQLNYLQVEREQQLNRARPKRG